MTIDDLKALISHGESECLEFKATTGQRTEGAKAVCAMLNGQGGHVLFGVNDRGDLKGQLVTAHTQEEVDRELRRLEPPAFPVIEVVLVHGDHSVIVLKVTAGTQGPFTFDGRPYLRQGPQTLVMPRNRYEDLHRHSRRVFPYNARRRQGYGAKRPRESCRNRDIRVRIPRSLAGWQYSSYCSKRQSSL